MRDVTEHLPDLPGLNNVRTPLPGVQLACLGCAAMLLMSIGVAISGWVLYGLLGILGAIVLCIIIIKLDETRVTIDERGITYIRWLHRRFIAWDDVELAITDIEPSGTEYIKLVSSSITLCLPVNDFGSAYLEASIFQHLRRVGKADRIALSPEAASFWYPIPHDIPEEMVWDKGARTDGSLPERLEITREDISSIYADDEQSRNRAAREHRIAWTDITDVDWIIEDIPHPSYLVLSSADSNFMPVPATLRNVS